MLEGQFREVPAVESIKYFGVALIQFSVIVFREVDVAPAEEPAQFLRHTNRNLRRVVCCHASRPKLGGDFKAGHLKHIVTEDYCHLIEPC